MVSPSPNPWTPIVLIFGGPNIGLGLERDLEFGLGLSK